MSPRQQILKLLVSYFSNRPVGPNAGKDQTQRNDISARLDINIGDIPPVQHFPNCCYSQSAISLPPLAPSPITTSQIGSCSLSVSITWTDNSNNETGFTVERSINSGSTYIPIISVGSNITSSIDTNVTASHMYWYRVFAFNLAGSSSFSNTSSVLINSCPAPNAPSGLTATQTCSLNVTLSWIDNSSDESGFNIQRSTDGIIYSGFTIVGANTSSIFDSSVVNGDTYWYRVFSYNNFGSSSVSNTASVLISTCSVESAFFNSQLTATKYCSAGPDFGKATCVTVLGNIFTSSISQQDADQKAINAASASLFDKSPSPCCNLPSANVRTTTWTTGKSDASTDPGSTTAGTAASFSGDVITGNESVTLNMNAISGAETSRICSVTTQGSFCNPWPQYNLTASFDYNISGMIASQLQASMFTSNGFSDTIVVSTNSVGTASFAPCPILFSGGNVQVSFALTTVSGSIPNSSGSAAVQITNFSLRPLTAPTATTSSCSSINANNAPSNDYFDSFITISGTTGSVNGDNTNATLEPGEPNFVDNVESQYSLWYRWTSPNNGIVTLTTHFLGGYVSVAAYTGSAVNNLGLVAGNGPFGDVDGFFPAAKIAFSASIGTNYKIQIASDPGDYGPFGLTWSFV